MTVPSGVRAAARGVVLFSAAERCSAVYRHTSLLVHPSVCGLLGCFCILAFINSAAVSRGTHVSFWVRVLSGFIGPFYFKKKL